MTKGYHMATPIVLFGGALDAPPEFALPILQAIGWTSLHWARLEQHLDVLLITLHKQEFFAQPLKRRSDSSWAQKVELFSQWFSQHDQLKQFAPTASRLSANLKKAGLDRNMLLHSNCIDFVEGPPSKVIALYIRGNKNGSIEQKRAEWTCDQILEFANVVANLNKELQSITSVILTETFLKSLRKSS
jgi:hypothetical protein